MPGKAIYRTDPAEVRRAERSIRIQQIYMVQSIEEFSPELQLITEGFVGFYKKGRAPFR